VVDAGPTVDLARVLDDLHRRGVRRLMVEGGRRVLTQLLSQSLADELQLVVAPVFVGDGRAPRFVDDGTFPFTTSNRARLAEVRRVGDAALLRYALTDRCRVLAEEM
jgi:5-amino-6-(5-phosphoribosylamino)uracil reductase